MTFDQLRQRLVPVNFGKVNEAAYARAVKALVRAGTLLRQKRPAAKLEPSEKLWLP